MGIPRIHDSLTHLIYSYTPFLPPCSINSFLGCLNIPSCKSHERPKNINIIPRHHRFRPNRNIRHRSRAPPHRVPISPFPSTHTPKKLTHRRNGGAGATGLIRALAEDYLSSLPPHKRGSITWICNHSRNTQLALLHDYVDIALTYAREAEAVAEEEGWSRTFGCVFHDHFVVAGPASDPVGVAGCEEASEALLKIRDLGRREAGSVQWHARNDDSATMWKERSLWEAIAGGVKPWEEEEEGGSWYRMSECTPAEAIRGADAAGAYLLTDRATLLRQTALRAVERTTVFFEPRDGGDVLMNSCYALYSPDERRERKEHRDLFLKYMISARGQEVIEGFGVEAGVPLFAGVREGVAGRRLRGGVPRDGKWIVS